MPTTTATPPRLSIVIPAPGNEETLEETLVSVLENRPEDSEIVVVLASVITTRGALVQRFDSFRHPLDPIVLHASILGLPRALGVSCMSWQQDGGQRHSGRT